MFAGIDVVTLDLQPVAAEVAVFALIVRRHVVGVERIVAVAALEDPAVASLRTEVCHDIGNVLTDLGFIDHNGVLITETVDINDGYIQCTAVVGGISFRIDHEVQPVSGRYTECRNSVFDKILSLCRYGYILLPQQRIVFERLDAYAVREVRVAVVLLKLCIADPQVYGTVYCRSPAEDRVMVEGRMDEVFLDRKTRGCTVEIFTAVYNVGYQLCISRACTEHIQPAVAALYAEVGNAVCVVI